MSGTERELYQAMTIIAMVTKPVTVVTAPWIPSSRGSRWSRLATCEASRWALSQAGGGLPVTVERRHASQQVLVGPRITGIASKLRIRYLIPGKRASP